MARSQVVPTGIHSTHMEQIHWLVTFQDAKGGTKDLYLRPGAFPEDYLRELGVNRPLTAEVVRTKA